MAGVARAAGRGADRRSGSARSVADRAGARAAPGLVACSARAAVRLRAGPPARLVTGWASSKRGGDEQGVRGEAPAQEDDWAARGRGGAASWAPPVAGWLRG